MIKSKNTKFLFVVLLFFLALSPSCKTSEKVPKEVKEAEKAELQAQKEAEKEYKLAVKHHNAIQSDRAKQNTKDLKKQQRKLNRSKKRSLWDQIFKNKCDKLEDPGL